MHAREASPWIYTGLIRHDRTPKYQNPDNNGNPTRSVQRGLTQQDTPMSDSVRRPSAGNSQCNEATGLDELEAPAPDQEQPSSSTQSNQKHSPERYKSSHAKSEASKDEDEDEEAETGLDELEATPPDQNPNEDSVYRHESLGEERCKEQEEQSSRHGAAKFRKEDQESVQETKRRRTLSQLSLHSYLIFFSILGVLARLGLVALTSYPGAPLATKAVWANVGGSLIIGFLREDRMLFHRHWHAAVEQSLKSNQSGSQENSLDDNAAHEAFVGRRANNHSFIGLTVGLCGTFTSFADIIRDAFLGISNNLDTAQVSDKVPGVASQPRSDGYSVLAVIAVLWIEVSMSLAALEAGAHMAIATQPLADMLPMYERSLELIYTPAIAILGWGCWIGAVIFAIFTPQEAWRGQAIFAVVFAPLGAILRYWLAKLLNPKLKSFPVGTFAANVLGTCVLGMVFGLQHTGIGSGIISCQILQGIGDGFCGGLTTVSTWVLELKALRLKHGYFYAFTSLAVCLACMIAIVGSVRWTSGFAMVTCEI
ncbi:Putative fluoride ion transporter CrcB [Septoria linicola]|uniref:Fluoride ion transporter CrcB n=1 Tax=Septoria linicola TaxID=215465 RepID=A0A9Q9EE08_9PEZI|nr:putative fluoride ion transporter CrcB [Septoria linicola]USW47370.1 Putative fluoride ion transporter CrcB [Septoria linicola]